MGKLRTAAPASSFGPVDPATTRSLSATSSETSSPAVEAKLDTILAAIESSRISTETKIGELAQEFNILRDEHGKLKGRITDTERALAELQPQTTSHQQTISDLQDRVRFLEGRAEDAEGRSRRNNIRVVGMPEGREGRDAVGFLEDWVKSFTPTDSLSPYFSLEWAHRVPIHRPPRLSPPTYSNEAPTLQGS